MFWHNRFLEGSQETVFLIHTTGGDDAKVTGPPLENYCFKIPGYQASECFLRCSLSRKDKCVTWPLQGRAARNEYPGISNWGGNNPQPRDGGRLKSVCLRMGVRGVWETQTKATRVDGAP